MGCENFESILVKYFLLSELEVLVSTLNILFAFEYCPLLDRKRRNRTLFFFVDDQSRLLAKDMRLRVFLEVYAVFVEQTDLGTSLIRICLLAYQVVLGVCADL